MIRWAITFLLISIVAGLFGFGLVAGFAWDAAKLLCLVFLVLFIVSLIVGGRTPRDAV